MRGPVATLLVILVLAPAQATPPPTRMFYDGVSDAWIDGEPGFEPCSDMMAQAGRYGAAKATFSGHRSSKVTVGAMRGPPTCPPPR